MTNSPIPTAGPAPTDRVATIRRFGSWAIDFVVIVAVVAVAGLLHPIIAAIVLLAGAPAYYLIAVGSLGTGTVGHRLMRIQVIDDRTGEPADLIRASLRMISGVALMLPFAIPAAMSIRSMIVTTPGRAWHDLASQTSMRSAR